MNTLETHLDVEKFSLKIHWKLTEAFLYNKTIEKIHRIRWERKRRDYVGTAAPRRGLREKKVTWSEWFQPHSGHPACPAAPLQTRAGAAVAKGRAQPIL